jgi:hypothetical protein
MRNHTRGNRLSLLRECEKLVSKLSRNGSVEGDDVRDPETVENREKQQWVFSRFSKRLSPLDQKTRSLDCLLGLWRSVALDVRERVYERSPKPDLFTTKCGGRWQDCNLLKGASELLKRFDKC